MTMTPSRILGALAAVAAIALSGCGDTSTTGRDPGAAGAASPPPSAAGAASPPPSAAGSHNAADVTFAQMMIPHHEQALELAALVPGRSDDAAVIALASAIAAQQQPEIDTLRAMLAGWGAAPAGDHAGHAGTAMAGMVDQATMARLTDLQGPEFDTLWLESMIDHHRGAVEMARTEVVDGENAEMVALARGIISAQQSEIDQMQQMLDEQG